jgi:hypothetical protein
MMIGRRVDGGKHNTLLRCFEKAALVCPGANERRSRPKRKARLKTRRAVEVTTSPLPTSIGTEQQPSSAFIYRALHAITTIFRLSFAKGDWHVYQGALGGA